jgi:phosphatidylglycerophosphatase C
MNVYDFDQTIFYPDSSYCFLMHCLKKYPAAFLPALPGFILRGAGKLMGVTSTQRLKEKIFSFVSRVPDVDAELEEFWSGHEKNIQSWYLAQRREDDLIISASPDFIVRPAAERLGVRLIATPMDKRTGRICGKNCHDEEKVRRFRAEFPDEQVEEFYSDSLHDTPMARLAQRAFIVGRGGKLTPWPD